MFGHTESKLERNSVTHRRLPGIPLDFSWDRCWSDTCTSPGPFPLRPWCVIAKCVSPCNWSQSDDSSWWRDWRWSEWSECQLSTRPLYNRPSLVQDTWASLLCPLALWHLQSGHWTWDQELLREERWKEEKVLKIYCIILWQNSQNANIFLVTRLPVWVVCCYCQWKVKVIDG